MYVLTENQLHSASPSHDPSQTQLLDHFPELGSAGGSPKLLTLNLETYQQHSRKKWFDSWLIILPFKSSLSTNWIVGIIEIISWYNPFAWQFFYLAPHILSTAQASPNFWGTLWIYNKAGWTMKKNVCISIYVNSRYPLDLLELIILISMDILPSYSIHIMCQWVQLSERVGRCRNGL